MITINNFTEAANGFFKVKKEQIYLKEDVNNACEKIVQILIDSLKENGVELTEENTNDLREKFFESMLDSTDVIIALSYVEGLKDSISFKQAMEQLG